MVVAGVVAVPTGVRAATYSVTTLAGSGLGSLRAAIVLANGNAGPDTITFAAGLTGTIPLGGTQLDIIDSVSIIGPGSDLLTIDAGGSSRVMQSFTPGVDLTLQGLTIRGGSTAGPGGGLAFFDGDELTITDVHFVENDTLGDGGGLAMGSNSGQVQIEDSEFTGNIAIGNGGAIAGDSTVAITNILIERTTITENLTAGDGGGIHFYTPERSVNLFDVVVSGNEASSGNFGGVFVESRFADLRNVIISDNSSTGGDGGMRILTTEANLNVTELTVSGNQSAGGRGGATFDAASFLNLSQVVVENNSGLGVGGIAATADGVVTIADSKIASNVSVAAVGGVFVFSSNGLLVERTTIADNTAPEFPGLYALTTPTITIDRSTVSGNTASGAIDGGGVILRGPVGAARIISSTISGNRTTGAGGGVFVDGVNVSVSHSTITANASSEGGGIARDGVETVTLTHSIVAGNEAPVAPDVAGAATAAYSLIGDTAGATIAGDGNLLDVDPTLGPLADNGGPTATHLPSWASAAIDAGNPAIALPPASDQRGFARIDGTIDIGAVETRLDDYPTPDNAGAFVGVTPARVFDSRPGNPPATGPKGLVGPDGSVDIVVLGAGGVPDSEVSAVVINVTATDVAGPSFVSAIPTPAGAGTGPLVSSVNTPRSGLTRSNLAVVPVGDGGRIRLYSKEAAHVIVDVFGYYELTDVNVRAGRMIPVGPHRAFDTRPTEPAPGPKGLVPAFGAIAPEILGVGPIPASGVSAVIINITATEVAGPSFVTVWPDGPISDTSSINISEAGETAANTVIVPVGADGAIRLFTLRSAHLIGDVVGYVTDDTAPLDDEGLFVATTPARLFDTRPGLPPGSAPKGALAAGATLTVDMAGRAGLPAQLGMVLMNVTATDAAIGFVTVFPAGTTRPDASTLNPNPDGDTRANTTIAGVGPTGAISFYSLNGTHLLADTAGYTLP